MKLFYHVKAVFRKISHCHCVPQRLISSTSVAIFLVLIVAALQIDNFISHRNRRYRRATIPRAQDGTMYNNDLGNIQRSSDMRGPGKSCDRYPPKAIVIGVTKCGTGALKMFLNAHPDIDNAPVKAKGTKSVNYFDLHYKEGLTWYLSQMPCSGPDRIVIDHTPQYFRRNSNPKRIYMFNSTIKLILLVREPISRTVSQYLQSKESHRGEEFGDVNSFVLDEAGEKINTENFAVSASSYHVHMQKWLEMFPLRQFQIIDVSELAKHPLKPLKELESFLGVRSYFDDENVYFNETRGFHCVKVYSKAGKYLCGVPSKGREHPQLTDTTYNLLKEHFDPLNDQFFKSIGKEFNWTTIKRNTQLSD